MVFLIVALFLFSVFQMACGGDDNDDQRAALDDDDDTGQPDDDDDDSQSDDDDDDDDDDDTPSGSAPTIANAEWLPSEVSLKMYENDWYSNLFFNVCDPDNDLSGGALQLYWPGFDEPTWIWPKPLELDDYADQIADVSDCENPAQIVIEWIFKEGSAEPPGIEQYLCMELEVTDGQGNKSNRPEEFCLFIP